MNYKVLEQHPDYEIYENGMIICRARLGKDGRQLKRKEIRPTQAKNRYFIVKLLATDGTYKQYYLHRLVYTTFNGDIGKLEVEHIDGNRANNALGNLRAVSHRENCNSEVSIERYRISNARDKNKYCRQRMYAAKSQQYYEKLIRTYKEEVEKNGHCGIWRLMTVGHCGYPRAKRIVNEMERINP